MEIPEVEIGQVKAISSAVDAEPVRLEKRHRPKSVLIRAMEFSNVKGLKRENEEETPRGLENREVAWWRFRMRRMMKYYLKWREKVKLMYALQSHLRARRTGA